MPRFIDVDALLNKLPNDLPYKGSVKRVLIQAPTVDVVPKSEVERLNKELDELAEEHSDLIVEKDELFDIAEKQHVEIEALKIANEKMYSAIEATKVEVARDIFEEIEKVLNRKIARSKPHFEKLKNHDEDFLSKCGCEDMGYFKGIISTCEDFQDLIAELVKKYTEGKE